MYRFTTKDGQPCRIDPNAVRAIVPSGQRTGYVKLVLDGGHAVTIEGETERIHEILMQYRLHPVAPSEPSAAERELPSAVGEAKGAVKEMRVALDELRAKVYEAEDNGLLHSAQ